MDTLDAVETIFVDFRTKSHEVAAIVTEMPNIERSFIRARDRVAEELRRLTSNVEQMISMIARAKEMTQAKLDEQLSRS